MQPPGDGWSVVRDYSTSSTFAWTSTANAGGYRFEVDARQRTSQVDLDHWSIIPYTLSRCSAGRISTGVPSPQAHGTTIAVQGGATCPLTPEYRFLVNGAVARGYSTSSTFNWSTASLRAGTYGLEVDARNQGSTDGYNTYAMTSFTLTGCTSARMSTSKASPQPPGGAILLTASSTCPATPEYRFLVGGVVVQNYSTANTYTWNTSGKPFGTYQLEVDVRAKGSTVGYDAWSITSFRLGAAPCASATLRTDQPSPQAPAGTQVVLTAGASCAGTPEYRFLVNGAVVQGYSTTNTKTWDTTGKTPGTYQLEVDVRNQGSPAGYESWAIVQFRVT